jgi:hypothetical protein
LGLLIVLLTLVYLKSILHYDPVTGWFIWLVDKANNVKKGARAGSVHIDPRTGYKRRDIRIDGQPYLEHHLAWFYMTGEWPSGDLDHKDTDSINNIWTNLRLVTSSQSAMNRGKSSRNTSGHKGVSWNKHTKKWRVRITVDGVKIFLGYYTDIEDAAAAYAAAAEKYHGEFARVI